MSRDRDHGYVPDPIGDGPLRPFGVVELGHLSMGGIPQRVDVAHARADEQNRDHTIWKWAKVSDDPEHWSKFHGHLVQVDVTFSTRNERRVNDWKGIDEIRPSGSWLIYLNRAAAYGQDYDSGDPLEVLLRIRSALKKLLGLGPMSWHRGDTIAALVGRPVWYERTPAVLTRVIPEQGAVILEPDGVNEFPPPAWATAEHGGMYDERDTVKADLFDQRIWWWR